MVMNIGDRSMRECVSPGVRSLFLRAPPPTFQMQSGGTSGWEKSYLLVQVVTGTSAEE